VSVAVWLGNAAPLRTIRWLDGALATGAKFERAGTKVTAVAAGEAAWLDLASDRATRAGVACVGVATDIQLDYLGWAQVVAAVAQKLALETILVDEASRPERAPEVAAIAELLDAAQLTHVLSLAPDGAVIHASRIAGSELMTCRVRGPAVIGVRVAGPAIEEYPTPTPSATLKRFDLPALGLDPIVLGHRALPPRAAQQQRRTVDRVAEHLAVHVLPRKGT
jgi:electron transfer flavoprotein alpha/beta subunit